MDNKKLFEGLMLYLKLRYKDENDIQNTTKSKHEAPSTTPLESRAGDSSPQTVSIREILRGHNPTTMPRVAQRDVNRIEDAPDNSNVGAGQGIPAGNSSGPHLRHR